MTRQQYRALDFIRFYIAEHGHSPSYREIAAHLGLASMNGVHRIVHALAEQGKISVQPDKSRSIELTSAVFQLRLSKDVHTALLNYAEDTETTPEVAAAELLRQTLGVAA